MRLLSPLTILAILLGYQIVTVTGAALTVIQQGAKAAMKQGAKAAMQQGAKSTMKQGAKGVGSGAARVTTKTGSEAAANAPKMQTVVQSVEPVVVRPEVYWKIYEQETVYDTSSKARVALAAALGAIGGNWLANRKETGSGAGSEFRVGADSTSLVSALHESKAGKIQFPNGAAQLTEAQQHELQEYLLKYQQAAAAAATAPAAEAQPK